MQTLSGRMTGLLTDYNFYQHVASDVGIDQKYLPASNYTAQDNLNYIGNWTKENLMKLNEAKCNYLVFSRSQENFATRLSVDNRVIDRLSVTKILGG